MLVKWPQLDNFSGGSGAVGFFVIWNLCQLGEVLHDDGGGIYINVCTKKGIL